MKRISYLVSAVVILAFSSCNKAKEIKTPVNKLKEAGNIYTVNSLSIDGFEMLDIVVGQSNNTNSYTSNMELNINSDIKSTHVVTSKIFSDSKYSEQEFDATQINAENLDLNFRQSYPLFAGYLVNNLNYTNISRVPVSLRNDGTFNFRNGTTYQPDWLEFNTENLSGTYTVSSVSENNFILTHTNEFRKTIISLTKK